MKKKHIFQLAIQVLTPVTHIYLRPWFWGPVFTPSHLQLDPLGPNSELQVLGTNSARITRWSHGAHVLRMDGIPGPDGTDTLLRFHKFLKDGVMGPLPDGILKTACKYIVVILTTDNSWDDPPSTVQALKLKGWFASKLTQGKRKII